MWDWEAELEAVENDLLHVELTSEDVCRLARVLPGDDPLLALLETEMREQGHWREPAVV